MILMTEAAMQGANHPIRGSQRSSVLLNGTLWRCCNPTNNKLYYFFSLCVCVSFKGRVIVATEATMTELMEDILSCGYNGPVNVEKREEIVRCNCFVHYADPCQGC